MNFLFTWKHEDGSIIEFSEHGWKSDDAEKATWLTEMSDLCSSSPTVPPGIHVWLQSYCRLIACEVPEGMISTDRSHNTSGERSNDPNLPIRKIMGSLHKRRNQAVRVTQRSINSACDLFFRSRGMPLKEPFNECWRRGPCIDSEIGFWPP
jgi:hypothetical protein